MLDSDSVGEDSSFFSFVKKSFSAVSLGVGCFSLMRGASHFCSDLCLDCFRKRARRIVAIKLIPPKMYRLGSFRRSPMIIAWITKI